MFRTLQEICKHRLNPTLVFNCIHPDNKYTECREALCPVMKDHKTIKHDPRD